MVNIHVNDNNNQIRINVPGINNTVSTQSSNPNNNVSSTIGNETFYNGLAKAWAISPDLVQGIDYSSKYYAGKAQESADIAESAIEDIGTAKDEAIDDISDAKTDAISDMETAKQDKITEIENTASDFEDDLTLLTQRAETAATNAQNSADYVVNNAPTATVTQTSTGATITTKDLTHGTTTANILNGAKGDKGDKGDQGEQGIQGIQGIQGEQGIQGIQGEQGEKGDKGDKGDTGDDGYSPTATVSKSGNTATITITDKNGTTTANVYDGVGSITDVQVDGTSVLDGSIAKIDLTGKYDASNPDGFISGITSSDVTTALGYTPYNATNPNGYITASALTGYATEQWVTNQNYVNSTTLATTLLDYVTNTSLTITLADYQPLLVSGTNIKTINNTSILGNGNITIQSAPDIDEISITTNTSDELQTVGVIDQNNTTNAIKTWTGTKAQYDAIVTKDSNTLYNIIDDTDVTFALLELLFPIGAVYFGTMSTCPLQTLGVGTWQALPQDKVIQIAGTRGSVGTTINESLPNITGSYSQTFAGFSADSYSGIGAITKTSQTSSTPIASNSGASMLRGTGFTFNAHNSNSTYQNNAPVQQDAYLLNGWRRIA